VKLRSSAGQQEFPSFYGMQKFIQCWLKTVTGPLLVTKICDRDGPTSGNENL
jgi:hypothetical protein